MLFTKSWRGQPSTFFVGHGISQNPYLALVFPSIAQSTNTMKRRRSWDPPPRPVTLPTVDSQGRVRPIQQASTLDLKKKRLEHGKSLLFSQAHASSQTIGDIYEVCYDGFKQLCSLDERFIAFAKDLFGRASMEMERASMNHTTAARIDQRLVSFMRLLGRNILLEPAQRAMEWLIRRFGYGASLGSSNVANMVQCIPLQHGAFDPDLPPLPRI